MVADVNQVEAMNVQAEADNSQNMPVLQAAADAPADLKDNKDAWHVGGTTSSVTVTSPPPRSPSSRTPRRPSSPLPWSRPASPRRRPCRRYDGPRPIEAIQVGDQVLGQHATTGALGFQPVVFLHHNPPGKTLRVSFVVGDPVVCSEYHRFWRANQGWAMARELEPGDVLRTLGGLVRVAKVEADATQPLYNLDVLGARTFFAGERRLLVHDNTLPDHRLKPFDALPVVESATRPA